jgi:transcriptional regulator with XRE-family HTH domain
VSDVIVEVGQLLASQRVREGLSLDEAAYGADVDQERLAAAESGELALNEAELQALADAYGVDVTAFFGGRITPKEYLFGG